jgi:glycosyltransferase involved in cell wall biosynthesis
MLPKVRVAHSGKQHSYWHALSLQRYGTLDRLITSGYFKPETFPDRWLTRSRRMDRFLRRRYLEGLSSEKVVRRWHFEIPEFIARKVYGTGTKADAWMFRRDARFDAWVADRWARDCDVFWGFQGSCLESLSASRKNGAIAVAEFATAHVPKAIALLSREAEAHPEWRNTISNFAFPNWYLSRLEQEPHAADYCVAASQFTVNSLTDVGITPERILKLPLGTDLDAFQYVERSSAGPLKVLFVGGVGQRKGVKYLLQAFDRLNARSIELTLAGPLPADMSPLRAYEKRVRMTGRLDQRDVIREMQAADVLVLPSVFEGFGLVIVEAMATGLPVIASTHSAGPDVIREGQDGFVLSPYDVEGLAARLADLAADKSRLIEMGQSAALRAQEFSWEAHAARLNHLIQKITCGALQIAPQSSDVLS